MKNFYLLLMLLILSWNPAFSQLQQIKIASFTVKSQLPSGIDNWNNIPASLLLVAQKIPSVKVEGVKLVLQIKANGAIVCGNNLATAWPVDNFTTRTFSASELTALLAGCKELKEGNYSICAQFYNIDRVAISNEVCKEFSVEVPKEIDYAPPTLITPENGKEFKESELQRPVMFRWTPLVPKPREPVTYRLRVWQLMQGQNGTQAMRSNQPIVSKDVDNITQAAIANLLTGPCKPPYLCNFIWNVQALNREGKPIGRNNGNSESNTFKVGENDIDIVIDSLTVGCCINGKQLINFTIKNNLPNTNTTLKKVWINGVNGNFGTPYPLDISASVSPSLPYNFLPPSTSGTGGRMNFTAMINCIDSMKTVVLKADAERITPLGIVNDSDVEADTLKCKCEACDEKFVNIKIPPSTNIVINNNNTLTLNQPISITTTPLKLVKNIKAELAYFEFIPESEDCLPCNRDSKTFGNFDNGMLANTSGTGSGTHSLAWNFTPPKNFTAGHTASMIITLPPQVKCCNATIRWCIRYVITFEDCTVCNKLVCYEKKKEGCAKENPNPNNDPK